MPLSKHLNKYNKLLVLPGKVFVKCLERKRREIAESKLEDGQSGFRPGRSTTEQIFTPKQMFEKCWEYGKDLTQHAKIKPKQQITCNNVIKDIVEWKA